MEEKNNQLKTILVIAIIAFLVYLIFTNVNKDEKYSERKCTDFCWRNQTCSYCVDEGKNKDENLVIYCYPDSPCAQ